MPTKIEWTDRTWNPTTGCAKVSPGCANCYIVRTPPFRMNHRKFERVGNEMTTGVILHPERLEQPLKWRKPQRIFVNSMSDLFHEDVRDEFLPHVFAVMAVSPRHTYQILTKRPERMLEVLNDPVFAEAVSQDVIWAHKSNALFQWPLPNVHLYVSVENQYWADRRIPLLQQTPAAVRGVSYEPALKRVDFSKWLTPIYCQRPDCPEYCFSEGPNCGAAGPGLSHIIMGGESGPKARPMNIDWVRDTIAQCKATDVPVFIKQLGTVWARKLGVIGSKGGDMEQWPEDLRIREFPTIHERKAS